MLTSRPAATAIRPRHAAGFTLVELMVGVALLAVLLSLAIPAFSDWMRNLRIRGMAESLRADLMQTRTEAIRRNTRTRLQFTSSVDASCTLSTSGPYWVANADTAQTPASACGGAISATTAPYLVLRSAATASSLAGISVTACRPIVGFDALGRQSATTNPTSAVTQLVVQLKAATGSCLTDGGSVRCLNVVVTPAGDALLCDPARTCAADQMQC